LGDLRRETLDGGASRLCGSLPILYFFYDSRLGELECQVFLWGK
jgi:hypothetical protein